MKKWFLGFILIFPVLVWANPGSLPLSSVRVFPKVGSIHSLFTIDVSGSRDVFDQTGALRYSFRPFREARPTQFIAQPNFTFHNPEVGKHTAQIWVMDVRGRVSTTTIEYRVQETTGRSVRIKSDLAAVPVGEEVILEVVISARPEEGKMAQVRWDFDSNGAWETDWEPTRFASTNYNQQGTVSPTVEVRFPDGEVLRETGLIDISFRPRSEEDALEYDDIQVLAPEIVAPVIHISPGYVGKDVSTVFKFDASQSPIPAYAWLEWSFDGEQFREFDVKLEKQFKTPGVHEVRVRACVNRSAPNCALAEFEVIVPDQATEFAVKLMAQSLKNFGSTIAVPQNKYLEIVRGDEVRLSSQILRHDQYGDLEYRWDYEGDGDWDTIFGKYSSIMNVYDRPGTYYPRVEVRKIRTADRDTVQGAEMTIEVVDNSAPEGFIEISPEKECFVGDTAQILAKVYDQETNSAQLQVRFDFDDDGIWDTKMSHAKSYSYTFPTPGEHTIKMQIIDPGKKSTTIKKKVIINDVSAVMAAVDVSFKEIPVGQPIQFDASRSTGQGLQYRWKIYGEPDTYPGSGQVTTRSFRYPGEKEVTLTVIDQLGNSDKVSFLVNVVPAPKISQNQVVVAPQNNSGDRMEFIRYDTDFDFLNVYD